MRPKFQKDSVSLVHTKSLCNLHHNNSTYALYSHSTKRFCWSRTLYLRVTCTKTIVLVHSRTKHADFLEIRAHYVSPHSMYTYRCLYIYVYTYTHAHTYVHLSIFSVSIFYKYLLHPGSSYHNRNHGTSYQPDPGSTY
jgi:hypothetical protein